MATKITLEGLPENMAVTATTLSRLIPLVYRRPRCTLMELNINDNRDFSLVPCFSCTLFPSELDYYNHYSRVLTAVIRNTVFLDTPQQNCAAEIAREVVRRILIPANMFDAYRIHRVHLEIQAENLIDDDEEEENRVVIESFEEAEAPQRKPCAIGSVIEMAMERSELKVLEAEKAESDWKDRGDHGCAICMEEIESVWESLKMPCSHVFHDKCLLRWLDNNHVCPLCRFELPVET